MVLRLGDKGPGTQRRDGRFEILGGRALKGTVPIFGAKNAATKMIAASLLTPDPCILKNVPRIEDVHRMVDIVEALGTEVGWTGRHTLSLRARETDPSRIPRELIGKLRASVVVLGALMSRFGKVTMPFPGGDIIGARPLDTHFDVFEQFGVSIKQKGNDISAEWRRKPKGPLAVVLKEFSVTATENALLLAACVPHPVTIHLAAAEPHVADLARFLSGLGVRIAGLGTHTVSVHGKKALRGCRHRVVPDSIDAITFLVIGAATGGSLTVRYIDAGDLMAPLKKLREFGATVVVDTHGITVRALRKKLSAADIQTLPHPGFPTDAQAPFAVLATQAKGRTTIYETMYENRFGYRRDLRRMGADVRLLNPHQMVIKGSRPLFGKEIHSLDIRAGAALVVAGLIAHGKTVVHGTYQIDRGYERIEERLQAVGADIKRIVS